MSVGGESLDDDFFMISWLGWVWRIRDFFMCIFFVSYTYFFIVNI